MRRRSRDRARASQGVPRPTLMSGRLRPRVADLRPASRYREPGPTARPRPCPVPVPGEGEGVSTGVRLLAPPPGPVVTSGALPGLVGREPVGGGEDPPGLLLGEPSRRGRATTPARDRRLDAARARRVVARLRAAGLLTVAARLGRPRAFGPARGECRDCRSSGANPGRRGSGPISPTVPAISAISQSAATAANARPAYLSERRVSPSSVAKMGDSTGRDALGTRCASVAAGGGASTVTPRPSTLTPSA
jgi:hypothetical protein